MIHSNNSDVKDKFPKKRPVPVICSFDGAGNMNPLYVRIDGEAYKICSSYKKSSFMNAAAFQCEIADHGQIKPLTLEYRYQERLWLIPK